MNKPNTLLKEIFPAGFEQRFFAKYRTLFSVQEIEDSHVLQWVFGATLLSFLITFYRWTSSLAVTETAFLKVWHLCWPWFQDCGHWYFLEALPYGYSQTTLYMVLFAIMLLIVFLMWKREWMLAHILMVILFLWKVLVMFVLTYGISGNFDYYHIVFAFILLFLPLKLFFLKLTFVLFYFLSATIKIHEGWILGTYFSALQTGIPLFPDFTIPIWTNIVIFMQTLGAWFLLSSNKLLQRGALVYFVMFHLYSGTIVEYHYPLIVLPTLLILFGPWYKPESVPLGRKALPGFILLGILFILQLSSVFIPGDEKITLEGNKYGMYMFEANHQCISNITFHQKSGTSTTELDESINARNRCDPYDYWFFINQVCKRESEDLERVTWTFDHSINGGPFYRIVETDDACGLEYHPWSHDKWIRTPEEGADIIGYPVKNLYY